MEWIKIDKKLKQANKARLIMDVTLEGIASTLQPFFSVDISILWQPSDGFVIVSEYDNRDSPKNIPIDHSILELKKGETNLDWMI